MSYLRRVARERPIHQETEIRRKRKKAEASFAGLKYRLSLVGQQVRIVARVVIPKPLTYKPPADRILNRPGIDLAVVTRAMRGRPWWLKIWRFLKRLFGWKIKTINKGA